MVSEVAPGVYVAVHERFLNARHGEGLPVRGESGPAAWSRDAAGRHYYRTRRRDRAGLGRDFHLDLFDHHLLYLDLLHHLFLHYLLYLYLFHHFFLDGYLFHHLLDHHLLYGHLLDHLDYLRRSGRLLGCSAPEGKREGCHTCYDDHHPRGELLSPHTTASS